MSVWVCDVFLCGQCERIATPRPNENERVRERESRSTCDMFSILEILDGGPLIARCVRAAKMEDSHAKNTLSHASTYTAYIQIQFIEKHNIFIAKINTVFFSWVERACFDRRRVRDLKSHTTDTETETETREQTKIAYKYTQKMIQSQHAILCLMSIARGSRDLSGIGQRNNWGCGGGCLTLCCVSLEALRLAMGRTIVLKRSCNLHTSASLHISLL